MEKIFASKIIESLAKGIDFFSGQEFPPNSPMHNVEVVRSLYLALSIMNNYKSDNLSYDNLLDKARYEQEEMWKEYCRFTRYEDPQNNFSVATDFFWFRE